MLSCRCPAAAVLLSGIVICRANKKQLTKAVFDQRTLSVSLIAMKRYTTAAVHDTAIDGHLSASGFASLAVTTTASTARKLKAIKGIAALRQYGQ